MAKKAKKAKSKTKKRKSGKKAAPARKKKRVVAKKSAAKKAKPKAKAAAKPAAPKAKAAAKPRRRSPLPPQPGAVLQPSARLAAHGRHVRGRQRRFGRRDLLVISPATKHGPDDGTGRLPLPTGEGADRVRRRQRARANGSLTSDRPRVGTAAANAMAVPDCVAMAGRNSIAGARRMPNALVFHPTRRRFAMPATYNILIMGASYGSLLASKLLFGGHR